MSALEKLIEENRWRPIEEAPKDGTEFEYKTSENLRGLATWIDGSWFSFACDATSGLSIDGMEATHFRSLPDDRLAEVCEVLMEEFGKIATNAYHFVDKEDIKQILAKAEAIAKGDAS